MELMVLFIAIRSPTPIRQIFKPHKTDLHTLCPQGVAEANREADGYVIKDGIVVVIKDSTIPDGTII